MRIPNSDNNCYYIFIQDKLAAPKAIKVDDLEHQIHCGILAKRTDDPYSKIIDESSCSKAEIEKRDKAYKIIEKYLKNSKWEILKKRSRMDKFKTIAESENEHEVYIRRIFSRYWQRGQTINSLLPDYFNIKKNINSTNTTKVNGRKRINGKEKFGLKMTDGIKILFIKAIDEYYISKKELTLVGTYKKMLSDNFMLTSNTIKPTFKYPIPSLRQFTYWYKSVQNSRIETISRKGENFYNLNERNLLNNSYSGILGPGSCFQIDATLIDAHMVSSINRSNLIGRALIYSS